MTLARHQEWWVYATRPRSTVRQLIVYQTERQSQRRRREEHAAVVGRVSAVADDEPEVVAGSCECGRGVEALGEPVRLWFVPVQVAVGCVEEEPSRSAGFRGEEGWVGVPVRHLRETRVERDRTAQPVRPGPGCGDGGVAAAAAAADPAHHRILRHRVALLDHREHFVE